jgi:hypothetical protein
MIVMPARRWKGFARDSRTPDSRASGLSVVLYLGTGGTAAASAIGGYIQVVTHRLLHNLLHLCSLCRRQPKSILCLRRTRATLPREFSCDQTARVILHKRVFWAIPHPCDAIPARVAVCERPQNKFRAIGSRRTLLVLGARKKTLKPCLVSIGSPKLTFVQRWGRLAVGKIEARLDSICHWVVIAADHAAFEGLAHARRVLLKAADAFH